MSLRRFILGALWIAIHTTTLSLAAQADPSTETSEGEGKPAAEPAEKPKIPLRVPQPDAEPPRNTPAIKNGSLELRAHFSLGLAFQGDLQTYADGLAAYSALVSGSNSGQIFSVNKTKSLGTHFAVGGETILEYARIRWVLSFRYVDLRDAAYEFKAAKTTETMTVAPRALPVSAMALFPLFSVWDIQVWGGGGFGICPASISLTYESSSGLYASSYWGWGFGVSGRVEGTTQIFGLPFFASLQGDYFPVQKYELNGVALINGNNGKVVGAGLSGFSMMIGTGYRF